MSQPLTAKDCQQPRETKDACILRLWDERLILMRLYAKALKRAEHAEARLEKQWRKA
jgi:hypothetical protein